MNIGRRIWALRIANLKIAVSVAFVAVLIFSGRWYLQTPDPVQSMLGTVGCETLELNEKLNSFYEVIDESSRKLVSEITNPNEIVFPTKTTGRRVPTLGAPFLDIEIVGTKPFSNILFAGLFSFYEDGTLKSVRDSHQRLRASRYDEEIVEPKLFRDIFPNVVVRRNAVSIVPSLQILYPAESDPLPTKKVSFFTKDVKRISLDNSKAQAVPSKQVSVIQNGNCSKGYETEIGFDKLQDKDIASRGVSFTIQNVAALYTVSTDHKLRTFISSSNVFIGALAPQSIGYRTNSGYNRTLSFNNADVVEVDFNKSSSELVINVYDYHYGERTSFSSRYEPDKNGVRQHVNLAISEALPKTKLSILHDVSDTIVFPLFQPGGRMASLVISEHADYVGVEQDNLTMYGNIKGEFVPGKGIIGRDIPVTKSVFPSGTPKLYRLKTANSPLVTNFLSSTVRQSSKFRDQLARYLVNSDTIEIAVHCAGRIRPEEKKNRYNLVKLLDVMAIYGATTWIDHGGKECIWESGWNPESDFYIVPTLKHYRYKYVNALGDKLGEGVNLIADGEPSNLLFYVPRFDDDTEDSWKPYFYNTTSLTFSDKTYQKENLQKLVDARGYLNIHSYLPYNVLSVTSTENGLNKLTLAPWYNTLLDDLKEYRDAGELFLATNEKMLGYILKMRKLKFYHDGKDVKILNLDALIKFKNITPKTAPTFGSIKFSSSVNIAVDSSEELGDNRNNGLKPLKFVRDGVLYQLITQPKKCESAIPCN